MKTCVSAVAFTVLAMTAYPLVKQVGEESVRITRFTGSSESHFQKCLNV